MQLLRGLPAALRLRLPSWASAPFWPSGRMPLPRRLRDPSGSTTRVASPSDVAHATTVAHRVLTRGSDLLFASGRRRVKMLHVVEPTACGLRRRSAPCTRGRRRAHDWPDRYVSGCSRRDAHEAAHARRGELAGLHQPVDRLAAHAESAATCSWMYDQIQGMLKGR